ncbi:hypothetical protein A1O3_06275 [Capronia epimyces CBS 606.96]|uniref:Uncharacterized protein n=1 Tax=Capronia epimyces CBS 606.96 TaxID=1182542 RepID=W9XPK2_9EURO|nr:uncharacterized protein A1O3_06275 [Capronia epimyces CBS 606.96]EXJ82462.1 hypothetical protein A1O3_06275 [Capronia epimyces CBS 606.96]
MSGHGYGLVLLFYCGLSFGISLPNHSNSSTEVKALPFTVSVDAVSHDSDRWSVGLALLVSMVVLVLGLMVRKWYEKRSARRRRQQLRRAILFPHSGGTLDEWLPMCSPGSNASEQAQAKRFQEAAQRSVEHNGPHAPHTTSPKRRNRCTDEDGSVTSRPHSPGSTISERAYTRQIQEAAQRSLDSVDPDPDVPGNYFSRLARTAHERTI